ncbi:MAG: helix-turn-helix domain-containing protein [Candidatus Kapaibacterium sp.]
MKNIPTFPDVDVSTPDVSAQILSVLTVLTEIKDMLLGKQNDDREALNFEQARAFIKCSKSHLYKLTSSGEVPFYKPRGKALYFNKTELENWLLQNKTQTSKSTTNAKIEQRANDYTAFRKTLRMKGVKK